MKPIAIVGIVFGVLVALAVVIGVPMYMTAPFIGDTFMYGAWNTTLTLTATGPPQVLNIPVWVGWNGIVYQNGDPYASIVASNQIDSISPDAPHYTVSGSRTPASFYLQSATKFRSSSRDNIGVMGIVVDWVWTR
mgnify:CR=1 FL=1